MERKLSSRKSESRRPTLRRCFAALACTSVLCGGLLLHLCSPSNNRREPEIPVAANNTKIIEISGGSGRDQPATFKAQGQLTNQLMEQIVEEVPRGETFECDAASEPPDFDIAASLEYFDPSNPSSLRNTLSPPEGHPPDIQLLVNVEEASIADIFDFLDHLDSAGVMDGCDSGTEGWCGTLPRVMRYLIESEYGDLDGQESYFDGECIRRLGNITLAMARAIVRLIDEIYDPVSPMTVGDIRHRLPASMDNLFFSYLQRDILDSEFFLASQTMQFLRNLTPEERREVLSSVHVMPSRYGGPARELGNSFHFNLARLSETCDDPEIRRELDALWGQTVFGNMLN